MPYSATEGNICPCCGTEFGYDDDFGVTFLDLRNRWVAADTPWFSPVDEPPPMWDGILQLFLADYEFTWPGDHEEPETSVATVVGTNIIGELVAA